MTGLLALCLAALPTTVPAAAATCARAAAAKAGTWFSATPPKPDPDANQEAVNPRPDFLNVVAVDPGNASVLFVSDGSRVLRSNDGGCTWSVVFALPEMRGDVPDRIYGEITSIDVARVARRTRVLVAVREASPVVVTRTVVVRSDDGYRGWTPVFDSLMAGLPPAEAATPVVHSAGNVAYVAVPAPRHGVAYARSGDGGKTWTVRTPVTGWGEWTGIIGFAVNPWRPDELWDWRANVLRRSADGGASWTGLDIWPDYNRKPTWYSADVAWPHRGGPARVLVLGEDTDPKEPSNNIPLGSWSGDGGRTFRVFVPPHRRERLSDALVAHLGNGDVVVLDGARRGWRIPHLGRPPRFADWRWLNRAPSRGCFVAVAVRPCNADAGGTRPGVVAMPTGLTLQLLQVAR